MRTLILASTSPRRKDLLTMLGVPFTVVASDFPEEDVEYEDFSSPGDYVATLAMGKALAVVDRFPDAIVLGVDTMVFLDGVPYGKPRDLDHAREMLKTLRGKTHQVYTAFCIVDTLTGEKDLRIVSTDVTFFPFSDEALERYIETSESLGKAGSYAIQMGAKSFVRSVDGSLSSVVGLPLEEVADALESAGIPIEVDVQQLIAEHFS